MSRYGAEHIFRWVWSGVAFLVLSVGASFLRPQRVLAQEIFLETAILADPTDAYYPLAQEIAQTEHIPLFHRREQALAAQPSYLLWVVSPTHLSDAELIAMAQSLSQQPVSVGIISASTVEQARALWLRAKEVRGEVFVAVNAANPAANIEPQITVWQGDRSETVELSKTNLLHYLQEADYLTFTGHGGSRYWRLDTESRLTVEDLPPLPPLVVQSGSCNTFRVWEMDSIALGFVDQGAAAYVGFAYSPNEGYLIGEFDGLPYRYSYPDFPIGVIVQLQNRGALQGFAALPYLFLLGDPRLSLQTTVPYSLVEDQLEGPSRVMVYHQVPEGFVPIRVKGGADYAFVEVSGVDSTSRQAPFYNSRLQMIDVGEDKFLLVLSDDDKLTLRLFRQAPWHWQALDILTDSLDFSLVFLSQSGGDWVGAIFAVFPLGWVLLQVRRKGWRFPTLWRALFVGSAGSLLLGGYAGLRLDSISIISKPVEISQLALGVNWFLACSGAWMLFSTRTAWKKAVALLVILFPLWFPLLYVELVVEGFNRLVSIPRLGVSLYNHHATQQVFIALIFVASLYIFLLKILYPPKAAIE